MITGIVGPAGTFQAPKSWLDQAGSQYRACELCKSGQRAADGQLTCTSRSVSTRGRAVPVSVARARSGACGPEALHLHLPGM